jgi:hypothetical protein
LSQGERLTVSANYADVLLSHDGEPNPPLQLLKVDDLHQICQVIVIALRRRCAVTGGNPGPMATKFVYSKGFGEPRFPSLDLRTFLAELFFDQKCRHCCRGEEKSFTGDFFKTSWRTCIKIGNEDPLSVRTLQCAGDVRDDIHQFARLCAGRFRRVSRRSFITPFWST